MYDSDLGRFYALDAAGQFDSPFLYAGNNPVVYVDPDGKFPILVPILIGAAIGGAFNVWQNWEHINGDWGKGLGFFFSGAASGALAGTGNPLGFFAGGFITGAGNAALYGGNAGAILQSGFIGGFSGLAGGYAGQWASKMGISLALQGLNVNNPLIGGFFGGAFGGFGGGFAAGFTANFIMTGNVNTAWNAGIRAGISGLGTGAAVGTVSAGIHAYRQGLNPLTGKPRVKGLSITEFQRFKAANDYKSGLIESEQAFKSVTEGGARWEGGMRDMGYNKQIFLESIGQGKFKVTVIEYSAGQIVNIHVSIGTALQLGLPHIQQWIDFGPSTRYHFLGK